MDSLRQIEIQQEIEERYNRKHIDKKIRAEIKASAEIQAKLLFGVQAMQEWLGETYYASKEARLDQLRKLDLVSLVETVFVGIAYVEEPQLFTSVSSLLAARLGFDDKKASVLTAAEILAVLCSTDAYDIEKEHEKASMMVVNRLPLSEELRVFIHESRYLPPMVCVPLDLENNYSSGYLSHKESLILGSGNHHEGNICLDVLNTANKVALKLDLEFLCMVEEDPNSEFTVEKAMEKAAKDGKAITEAEATIRVQQQKENWHSFKGQSYEFYSLMHRTGNNFHLCHRVDKRGRIYASGYHISTQGTAFKKAMVELANEEIVEGVPT